MSVMVVSVVMHVVNSVDHLIVGNDYEDALML